MALSKKQLSPYFLFGLLLILAWVSFRVVGVFLNYLLLGLFFAYISYPAYQWLLERVRRPTLAAIILLLAITAVVLVPTGFLIVELTREMRDIVLALDVDTLRANLDALSARFDAWFGGDTSPDSDEPGILEALVPNLSSSVSRLATRLIGVLIEGIIGVFLMLYIMYYTYLDGDKFVSFIHDILPMQEAHRDLLFSEVGVVIRAVMFGSVLTALIQAILGAIGFIIFGVPNVAFWSVIMFILALLPIIGPPLAWGPWGVYLILSGRTFEGVGLLVYSAIMVSSIDNIIRPKLIGSRAQVHPVIILVGVLGGLAVFGFSGFILGPLVLSVFVTILSVYRKEFASKIDEDGRRSLTSLDL